MKLGAEDKKKAMIAIPLGVAALACALYIYSTLSGSSNDTAPASTAAPVVMSAPTIQPTNAQNMTTTARPIPGGAARKVASAGQLDPTLHMAAMEMTESVAYTGSGRNIFSASSAPVEMPHVIAPVRPVMAIASARPPMPAGPPPPPPIDLKFFGTVTSASGVAQAFLLHGDDVYVASSGEIVGRRYKVISIGQRSVVVEDMPNSNQQTLPLEAQ